MSSPRLFVVIGALAGLAAPAAVAQDAARPALLDQVTACRDVGDSTARLACYDSAVAALDAAERQGEVVVVDREQVRESRRALFGFELPPLPAFGRVAAGEEDISSIDSTLSRASRGGDGKWVFHLAEGSVWRQIDSGNTGFLQTSQGTEVRVRRATLGSFMLTVGNSRAIRVRREQ